ERGSVRVRLIVTPAPAPDPVGPRALEPFDVDSVEKARRLAEGAGQGRLAGGLAAHLYKPHRDASDRHLGRVFDHPVLAVDAKPLEERVESKAEPYGQPQFEPSSPGPRLLRPEKVINQLLDELVHVSILTDMSSPESGHATGGLRKVRASTSTTCDAVPELERPTPHPRVG